jgi:hypothetical protein
MAAQMFDSLQAFPSTLSRSPIIAPPGVRRLVQLPRGGLTGRATSTIRCPHPVRLIAQILLAHNPAAAVQPDIRPAQFGRAGPAPHLRDACCASPARRAGQAIRLLTWEGAQHRRRGESAWHTDSIAGRGSRAMRRLAFSELLPFRSAIPTRTGGLEPLAYRCRLVLGSIER